ncbi:MAG: type II secretion system protein [Gallionella sp.]
MFTSDRMTPQRGISLIELIMFIVIVSVALAGILLVMNQTTGRSADPLIRKQAIAAAYSLLEEIQLQDFTATAPAVPVAVTPANRATAYHIVGSYGGFATAGIFTVNNVAIPDLAGYTLAVAVIPEAAAWNGIPPGNVVQINVTVTAPNGDAITATGFRTAYN